MKDGTKKFSLFFKDLQKAYLLRLPVLPQKSDNFCHKYENFAYQNTYDRGCLSATGTKQDGIKFLL
jgi:hypothetical protein